MQNEEFPLYTVDKGMCYKESVLTRFFLKSLDFVLPKQVQVFISSNS